MSFRSVCWSVKLRKHAGGLPTHAASTRSAPARRGIVPWGAREVAGLARPGRSRPPVAPVSLNAGAARVRRRPAAPGGGLEQEGQHGVQPRERLGVAGPDEFAEHPHRLVAQRG